MAVSVAIMFESSAAAHILLQRQLLLFGKALRLPYDDLMHSSSFIHGSLQATTSKYVRRVQDVNGLRTKEVRNKAFQIVNGHRERGDGLSLASTSKNPPHEMQHDGLIQKGTAKASEGPES